METTTKTIDQFIVDNQITMTVQKVAKNPNMSDLPRNFKCTLIQKCMNQLPLSATCPDGFSNARKLVTHFSQGSAHTKQPTVADVLDCLASDAAGYANARNFEDWAAEYGYDTDSRKAEKTFKAVEKSANELEVWLGEDLYQELLWKIER